MKPETTKRWSLRDVEWGHFLYATLQTSPLVAVLLLGRCVFNG